MIEVGTAEAKAHLTRLLNQVESGEEVTITRHGRPVARLIPAAEATREQAAEAVAALRELRRGNRLDGLSIRELIEEGRRF